MTMSLVEIARRTIEKHTLLKQGDGVVVGVSGGPDSMALLHVLVALRPELDLSLHVAHLNHRLRPDADADAQFVTRAADRLGLDATVEGIDVRALAASEKRSLEDAGRQARYRFFERVAGVTGASTTATAHTRDDQVETVVMRLLQGGPWEGLSGIPPARTQGTVIVVRPLLEAARPDVLAYLEEREIAWREDPTNRDQRILRNWVRFSYLPQSDREHPGARALLVQLADLARAADRFVEQQAETIFRGHAVQSAHALYPNGVSGTGQQVALPLDVLRAQPDDVTRRLVRRGLSALRGTDAHLPRVTEERLLRLVRGGRAGREVEVGAFVIRRGYETLEVAAGPAETAEAEYRLAVPGSIRADAFGVVVTAEVLEAAQVSEPRSTPAGDAYVDGSAAGDQLIIRRWRPGDKFVPLGLRGTKKVHDFYVDGKVPRWTRNRIPLVTGTGGAILWIVGHRLAEPARVTPASRRVVRLRVTPITAHN